MTKLSLDQQAHILKISHRTKEELEAKYEKGALQHGGNLWEKKDLIDMAIEEVLDLMIYLKTLKEQINNKTIYTVNGEDSDK